MRSPRAAALGWAGGVGVLCLLLAAGVAGLPGVWGALAGVVVALGFLWSSAAPLTVARWDGSAETAGSRLSIGLGVLLLLYTLRLAVALLLLATASRVLPVDRTALGLSAIACALTWSLAHVVLAVRERVSYVVPHDHS
ncbi:hypothetical protein BH24ACT13_BH24ACT13_00020 [soil metagenome]|jgi:hypothetical protein